jgi:hypothetical protein
MKLPAIGMVALLSTGCGHALVDYSPMPDMNRAQAERIIEQVFLEDYDQNQRPDAVLFADDYILLADGVVTRGTSVGGAALIGSGALMTGSSKYITKQAGLRIYYNSLGRSTLHTKRARNNRFAILIRNREGAHIRRVSTTNEQRAKQFLDALEYMRTHSS